MKRLFYLFPFLILFLVSGFQNPTKNPTEKSGISEADQWVNSIFDAMTPDERLGQLMMIRAHSDKGPKHIASVEKLIKDYHVGGLCFFQGTPEKQVQLINQYQQLNRHVPMMISMDAEWGLGMRFKKDGMSFPKSMMLGAIQDNRLIYDMGKEVARQLRRVGVHINFAPVVDVNNNPNNPVINTRSFGEDRYNVAAKSYMYMMGLQDGNVMACAKHFPGHGDTDVDSHYDLPIIAHDRNRLDSIELLPFRVLAQHGLQSMMIAHLQVPAIDDRPNTPTTLSSNAIDTILKKEMRFDGLIFTDGLGMKGVTKHHQPGEVEAKALMAGNDVLLLPEDVGAAFKAIKQYIAEGKLSQAKVDASVKKILRAKYNLGLQTFEPIKNYNIRQELETPKAQILQRQLVENALTLVRNEDNLIPLKRLDNKVASLSIGASRKTIFQENLDQYGKIDHYQIGKDISSTKKNTLLQQFAKKETVIVALHDMSNFASKDFGFTASMKSFIQDLNKQTKVILTVFGTPYALKYFDDIDHILVAYTEQMGTQKIAAQALLGVTSIRGRLPVTGSTKSPFNVGVNTVQLHRMGFDTPQSVGISPAGLLKIDTLMQEAIKTKATPGGVVLVAKDGKIVFEKAYGYHTYSKKTPVSTSDLFDLASITKIAAATLAVMKLSENGQIDIDQPMSRYLPALQNTNKASLTTREMMTHHSGLRSWIKFYENTLSGTKKRPKPSPDYYKKTKQSDYSVQVANQLFLQTSYAQDSMYQIIYDSELRSNKNYKYSDLGFYLVAAMVKEVTGRSLDQYVFDTFYQPMGLDNMLFNPLEKVDKKRIPPTEKDDYFRLQTIQGHVHDMGSAMLGGVSGHAGLFSDARDLAALMQMLLNGGIYGGTRYLQSSTIRDFTKRCTGCTRRGTGFDMKQLDESLTLNTSEKVSTNTYGHLGFTGTCVWVDPDHDLIYILLSNRTYPDMFNYKFSKENYRPRIHSAVYEAMGM